VASKRLIDSTGAVVAELDDAPAAPEAAPEPPYARFAGDGSMFFGGIPARDLSRAEWDAIPGAVREAALATGLYTIA